MADNTAARYEHYIPKFYLKGFLDQSRAKKNQYCVWVYRPNQAAQLRPYTKVGGEHGFYDHEEGTELEGRLSAIEDRAARLQRRLMAKGSLVGADRRAFADWVGLMATRGKPFFEMTTRTVKRIHEVLVDDPILDPASIAPQQPTRAWVLNEMIECGQIFGQLFAAMTWWLMQVPSENESFVTCDTPIMLSDPKGTLLTEKRVRYSKRSWFTFPLTATHCLHGHFRSTDDAHGRMKPFEFRNVNHHTIGRATNEVYGAEKSDAIQRLVNKLIKPRQVHEGALARDLNYLRERKNS